MTHHQIIWIEKSGLVHHIADSDFQKAYRKALEDPSFKKTRLTKDWRTSRGEVWLYVDMTVDK